MTSLQTKSFAQVVSDQATAVQGNAASLADFSVGSILRACAEAVAMVAMWLQGMILQLLTTTRAATSQGSDLDSWMGDYTLVRLPAVAATGAVTFARFTPTLQAIIPVGTLVQTADGTEQFAVIADTTQAAYSAALGAYVIAAATSSITATVAATVAGVGGNVGAGMINTLSQAISGVDTVSNAAAFATGANAEGDAAFRARFVNFLASLARATPAAVKYAATSFQQGMTATITEGSSYAGSPTAGYFYVIPDDGTGSPSSATLATVGGSVEAVRPIGITYGIFAPTTVTANVVATIATTSGYNHAAVCALVSAAINAYVAALPLGQPLVWSRLYQIAYDASPGVAEVTALTVNSATSDLAATAQQAIIPGTVSVS